MIVGRRVRKLKIMLMITDDIVESVFFGELLTSARSYLMLESVATPITRLRRNLFIPLPDINLNIQ